ncbi:MAG TPA: hypothetical protein VHE35_17930 [Kofleriaceae bacterium]|nr:hypothetical protein [Kofleriaceae bacterium]
MRLTAAALVLAGIAGAVAVAVVVAGPGRAEAYPEFQFSTGATRCSECHLSPVGGGLLTDYGREEAGDTIAGAGDGAFLHGLVTPPSWLSVGGDLRLATFAREGRGTEAALFPMQAEVSVDVHARGLSVAGTFGVLDAIRDAQPLGERLGSREHYVMYQPASEAWYVRAGRFFPAFGLRLLDHTAYVRRYTGLHTLEESYGLGAGTHGTRWELHASLLTPIEVAPVVGRHGWGYAVEYERLMGSGDASWSVSSKGQHDDDGNEAWLGLAWKQWLGGPRVLLSAEVDGGPRTLDSGMSTTAVLRLAGYAAVSYRPGSRWGAGVAAQLFDPDVRVNGQTSSALDATFSLFPRAHWELAALLRGELADLDHATGTGLLQLHYFL